MIYLKLSLYEVICKRIYSSNEYIFYIAASNVPEAKEKTFIALEKEFNIKLEAGELEFTKVSFFKLVWFISENWQPVIKAAEISPEPEDNKDKAPALEKIDKKGFVFTDSKGALYWVTNWFNKGCWICYWHKNQSSWVSLRKIESQQELNNYWREKIPDEKANTYHEMHKRFIMLNKTEGEKNV